LTDWGCFFSEGKEEGLERHGLVAIFIYHTSTIESLILARIGVCDVGRITHNSELRLAVLSCDKVPEVSNLNTLHTVSHIGLVRLYG
jgi:hypothetical protein